MNESELKSNLIRTIKAGVICTMMLLIIFTYTNKVHASTFKPKAGNKFIITVNYQNYAGKRILSSRKYLTLVSKVQQINSTTWKIFYTKPIIKGYAPKKDNGYLVWKTGNLYGKTVNYVAVKGLSKVKIRSLTSSGSMSTKYWSMTSNYNQINPNIAKPVVVKPVPKPNFPTVPESKFEPKVGDKYLVIAHLKTLEGKTLNGTGAYYLTDVTKVEKTDDTMWKVYYAVPEIAGYIPTMAGSGFGYWTKGSAYGTSVNYIQKAGLSPEQVVSYKGDAVTTYDYRVMPAGTNTTNPNITKDPVVVVVPDPSKPNIPKPDPTKKGDDSKLVKRTVIVACDIYSGATERSGAIGACKAGDTVLTTETVIGEWTGVVDGVRMGFIKTVNLK